MKAFDCPDHDHLVPDLALGRLDDLGAEKAESARRNCAMCSSWWDETFSDSAVAAIDAEVWDVFQAFEPPSRRRHYWLAAVAAAAMLAIGVAMTAGLWRGKLLSPVPSIDLVSTWDFEGGDLNTSALDAGDAIESSCYEKSNDAIFSSNLESGGLAGWSVGSADID
jgi:hypothetical protein